MKVNQTTQTPSTEDVKNTETNSNVNVTNTNTNENVTNGSETNNNETNTNNDKTIPYNRFKEINDAKKDLETQVQNLQKTIESLSTEKQESVSKVQSELLEKINNMQVKYEKSILDASKANDTDYVKFLVDKEVSKNNSDFETELEKIKTAKPDLFKTEKKEVEKKSTPGSKPNSSTVITPEMFKSMNMEERKSAIKNGYRP